MRSATWSRATRPSSRSPFRQPARSDPRTRSGAHRDREPAAAVPGNVQLEIDALAEGVEQLGLLVRRGCGRAVRGLQPQVRVAGDLEDRGEHVADLAQVLLHVL